MSFGFGKNFFSSDTDTEIIGPWFWFPIPKPGFSRTLDVVAQESPGTPPWPCKVGFQSYISSVQGWKYYQFGLFFRKLPGWVSGGTPAVQSLADCGLAEVAILVYLYQIFQIQFQNEFGPSRSSPDLMASRPCNTSKLLMKKLTDDS